eukprot:797657-Amorphochlora_amoeboformis.AAC.1
MIERVSLIQDDCTALGLPLWVNRVEIDELVISISTFQLLEVPPVVTLKGVRVDLGRQLRSQEPKTSARPEGYSIWENLRRFLILNTAIYVDRLDVRNVDFTSISFRDVKSTVHSTLAKEGRRHWSKHVKTKPIGCGWTYERTTQCDLADIQIRGAPMATLHALSFTHSFPQVSAAQIRVARMVIHAPGALIKTSRSPGYQHLAQTRRLDFSLSFTLSRVVSAPYRDEKVEFRAGGMSDLQLESPLDSAVYLLRTCWEDSKARE